MIELVATYLLEKGGIFGVLLAFSMGWIAYRERFYWNKDDAIEKEKKEILEKIDATKKTIDDFILQEYPLLKLEISSIKTSLDTIKSFQKDGSLKVDKILELSDDIAKHIESDEDYQEKINKDFDSIKYSVKEILSLKANVIELTKKIQDLWDWHSVKDSDGLPVWYTKKSLELDIQKINDSINNLNNIIEKNSKDIILQIDNRDTIVEKLQEINEDRIDDLKSLLDTYSQTMKDLSSALDKIKFLLKANLSED